MLKALIIVNIGVFIFQCMFGFPPGRTDNQFTQFIVLSSEGLMRFEVWRLGTHMFGHLDITHILFNMWGLYIFGKPLEQRVGSTRFLHIYLLSGFIGAAAWLLFNWGTGGSMLGASGAVFGVLAAAAMSFPNLQYMLLIPPVPMKLKTLAVVFGVIEVFMLLSHAGGKVARLAHLGGMLGGFIYMQWIFPGSGFPGRRGGFFSNLKAKMRQRANQKRFRVKHPSNDNSDEDYSSAEVDRILDKIGEKGLSSLSQRERQILEKARERLKGKH